MRRLNLSRRSVLRGAGGAILGLPWLEAMSEVRAQETTTPKRLVIVYTPNGNVPSKFWPTGGETDFTLSPMLLPLLEHENKITIHKNVDLLSGQNGPGDAHQKGTGSCLTGVPLQEGNFPGDDGLSAGWGDGISIDQEIANHIGGDTRLASLELGVLVSGANVGSRISYRGPARPIPPENSPYIARERIFGDPDVDPELAQLRAAQQRTVVDRVQDEYQRLSARLGAEDRQKLAAHIESLSEIEGRLGRGSVQYGGACAPVELDPTIDLERRLNQPIIGQMQMDLLAMALACDATRVASLMWINSATRQVFNWLGDDITEGHHPIAHKGDEDLEAYDHLSRINLWYAEQFAYLLTALDSVPEGDGTLLDNCVVLWVNEQMKGNTHDRNGMPYVTAGGLSGTFKTGSYLTHPLGSSSNQLFVSLLQGFGIEADSFGRESFGTGPLSDFFV